MKDGVLAPEGPAFKAMLISNGSLLSTQALNSITTLAKDGLAILIEGSPAVFPSESDDVQNTFPDLLRNLRALPSVHSLNERSNAQTLASLGIEPFARVNSTGRWITNRRYDADSDTDYLFILNVNNASAGSITIKHDGYPYVFDAWTGKRTALLNFQRDLRNGNIIIPWDPASQETKNIVFTKDALSDVASPSFNLETAPSSVIAASYDCNQDQIVLHVASTSNVDSAQTAQVATRTGTKTPISIPDSDIASKFDIHDWNLTLEHWEAPENLFEASQIARRRNSTHHLNAPLESWTALESSLQNASGVGYYSSSFDWPPEGEADGAQLAISTILHATKLFINGQKTQPLDPTQPVTDISAFLQEGKNEILAIVPSTMWNYLRTMMRDLKTGGMPAWGSETLGNVLPFPPPVKNGLIGSVTITPYKNISVGGEA